MSWRKLRAWEGVLNWPLRRGEGRTVLSSLVASSGVFSLPERILLGVWLALVGVIWELDSFGVAEVNRGSLLLNDNGLG